MQTIGRVQIKEQVNDTILKISPDVKTGRDPRDVSSRNYDSYKKASLTTLVEDFSRLYGANKHGVSKILLARGVVRNYLLAKKLSTYVRRLKSKLTYAYGLQHDKMKSNPKKVPDHIKDHYMLKGRVEALNEVKREISQLLTVGFEMPDSQNFKRLAGVSSLKAKEELEHNGIQ